MVTRLSDWIRKLKEEKEKISQLSPKDRLGYVDGCMQCINAVGRSNLGWLQWLTNPSLMAEFDEATLKQFFEKLKEFTEAYLQFDLEATGKSVIPKSEERGRERRPYV